MSKRWQIELSWIAALLLAALLVDFLLFKKLSILQSTRDVQLHDTYFNLPGVLWFASLFMLLATPIYLIKEARRRFSRLVPNLVVATLLLLLLFSAFFWHNVTHSLIGGWRVYPPLSSEAMQGFSPASFQRWNIIYISGEAALLIGLILLGIRTRKLANQA